MRAGENRGEPRLSIISMEDRVFLGHSLALESRGEAQAPPFHLPQGGSAGEWASTAGSSPSATGRLRGNGDSWQGGAGKGELAQLHQLERLTEGLVGLLSMELGKMSSGWPAEDGSPSRQGQRVREEMWELGRWSWERVNTDAYLLAAACQEKESRTPRSRFKSQAMSSGHILCWLKPS